MKTNYTKFKFIQLFFLVSFTFLSLSSTGQTSSTKEEIFSQAMLDLGQNKILEASKLFEQLYASDSTNMNLAYLLGQSYVRLDTNISYTIYLLEKASEKYSPNYITRDFSERRVSEYVYYYLLMAYSKNGSCDKTIGTLNKFYSIYSFSNEYYLVEGQRYHRECDKSFTKSDSAEMIVYEKERVEHWVSTKTIAYTNKQPLYGVQIGATLEPKYTWEFTGVKNVEVYVDENGVYRYIIGKLLSPIAADRILGVIKDAGYPDAYVVNVKDKTRFSERVVNMDNRPITDELVGEVVFRIQIGAFKSDTIPDDLAYLFVELDSISEFPNRDWTYLTVGKFTELNEARFYLELIQDIGVKDAFVTAFNYGRKVDIRQAEAYIEEQRNSYNESVEKSSKKGKRKNKK